MATAFQIEAAGSDPVRAELCARVRQLGRDHAVLSVRELGRRADALRAHAGRHGYAALARLAGGLGDALAADGRAATVRTYVELMDDALGCTLHDAQAGDALLAAASVRLA